MIFYHLIGLIISLSVLIWGADKFIDNSSLIAKKLGLSELTIGLTIVALGTSAPEIFVGISSVLNGTESIAMGAVVGSNISNIALIFGVSCIGISMQPAKTNPIQFIPFILAVIVLGLGLQDLQLSKAESVAFLFVFAAFMYVTYLYRIPETIDESDNSNIKIDIEGDNEINLSVDSRMYSISSSTQIEISKADFTIKTIKFDDDNFYKRLREKLFWGQDMRNKIINN